MSQLRFMERLLDGVEVKFQTLKEVFDIAAGGDVPKNALSNIKTDEFNIPILSNGIDKKSLYGWTNKAKIEHPSLTISARGTIGWTSFQDKPFFPIVRLLVLTPKIKLNLKYAYYYMKAIENNYNVSKNGIPQLTKPMIKDIQIPIPPLEVQSEIVRILDNFTELTAELTAELSARKKQYTYYRDTLLSFEEGEVEWKKLGDLCMIGDGLHGTPKYDINGQYFFINGNNLNNGSITFKNNTKKVDDSMFKKHGIIFTIENTVFLSINGTIGNVAFYNNEKIVLGKSVAFFKIKSPELNLRYLFYFLQTNLSKKYFEVEKTGSTIKNLGLKALRSFQIPIPPLEKQKEIVTILDKFDTLTHSISEGLPKEIALRQKQYEYYRDLLLSFPKVGVTDA